MRDAYPAPDSVQCPCCLQDIGCGDHRADCASRDLTEGEIEALAGGTPEGADLPAVSPSMRQIQAPRTQGVGRNMLCVEQAFSAMLGGM
jgi:hypothetical protein